MVRGCFWGNNRGTFCPFVVKSVNARRCLKLLEYLVLPVVQHFNDTIGDPVFQQDNAPVHTCKGAGRGIARFNGTADDGSGSARCGTLDGGRMRAVQRRRHGRGTVQRAAARTRDGAAGGSTDEGRCSGQQHGRGTVQKQKRTYPVLGSPSELTTMAILHHNIFAPPVVFCNPCRGHSSVVHMVGGSFYR